MTTIPIPAHVGPLPQWTFHLDATEVTDDMRKASEKTSDVADWTHAHRTPPSWQGADANAAGQAAAAIATKTDAATSALERGTRACEIYVSTMIECHNERQELQIRRRNVNEKIDDLARTVDSHAGQHVPESEITRLEDEARALASKERALLEDIRRWQKKVTTAEDRLIQALRSVDTYTEGVSAEKARGQVDTHSLLQQLHGKKSPQAVTAWWRGLSPAQRDALLHDDPRAIGNTNGIPAVARDDANRRSLNDDIERLRSIPPNERLPEQSEELRNAEAAERALDLDTTRSGKHVDTYLLAYQPKEFGGDGGVAVAYGNPDTADNTAVVVPGLGNDGSTIAGTGQDAQNVYDQSNRPGESTSTIAWMGYDAPSPTGPNPVSGGTDFASVATPAKARAGGHLLDQFVDGLRATHTGHRTHLTVIGHSYGSTTAADAAHYGLHADNLVLVGSPGTDLAHNVQGLHMRPGSVYVGSRPNDPVTWFGGSPNEPPPNPGLAYIGQDPPGLGADPAQQSYGAKDFNVGTGDARVKDLLHNHTTYFDESPLGRPNESLRNISRVVDGSPPSRVAGRTVPAIDYGFGFQAHRETSLIHDVERAASGPGRERGILLGGGNVTTNPVTSFEHAFVIG